MTSEIIPDNIPIGDLVPNKSEYLGKGELPPNGLNLTIRGFKRELVKGDDVEEVKTVIYWVEPDVKKFILNKVNAELLALYTGAQNAGQARGKQINVFFDPSIMFGNKRTGGIRLRAPQAAPADPWAGQAGPTAQGAHSPAGQGLSQLNRQPASGLDPNDDIPF